MKTLILLILLSLYNVESSSQVTIIGPKTLKRDSNFKIYVAAENLSQEETLVVALRSKTKTDKKIFSGNSTINEEIEFDVPFDVHNSFKFLSLVISETANEKICQAKEEKLQILNSKNFFNLIQFDKPLYRPGDEVRFRVLTLDDETKPFDYRSMKVDVLYPNGTTSTRFSGEQNSIYGLFEGSLWLSEDSLEGKYQLVVSINENKIKSAKSFKVKNFIIPDFQVYVNSALKVALIDMSNYHPSIKLNIYATYPFGQTVNGNVKIEAKVFFKDTPSDIIHKTSRNVQIYGRDKVISFDVINELKIKFIKKTAVVHFDINFTDEATNKTVQQSHQVEVLPSGRHKIILKHPKKAKPGFDFKVDIEVVTLDGKPEKSTSIPLKMVCNYIHHEESNFRSPLTAHEFLINGRASFVLNPTSGVKSIELTFEFEDTKLEKTIEMMSHQLEAIQMTYDKQTLAVGDVLNITVQSKSLMNSLKVLVMARNGLTYSENFPQSKGSLKFNFSLSITSEMAPECTVIVFYVQKSNGELIYDLAKLEIKYRSENHLSITPSSTSYKPKDTAILNINTMKNSLVGLYAIDQSIQHLGGDDHITNEDVSSKLMSLTKFDGELYFDIFESNVFIHQTSKEVSHSCKDSELSYLEKNVVSYSGLPSDEFESEEEKSWRETFEEINNGESFFGRKYFPDVWLFNNFKVRNSPITVKETFPDSMTTWLLSGFSINPEYGLAIAEPQSIKVFQEFFINIRSPNFVMVGEIFEVEVTVHNYLKEDKNVNITLKEGEFKIMKEVASNRSECAEYEQIYEREEHLFVNANSRAFTKFLLKPVSAGKVKINLVATTENGIQDEVEREIKVTFEGITKYKSHSMLIDLRNENSFSENFTIKIPNEANPYSVIIEVSLSGNLLGPAMENVEELIKMPLGGGEHRMNSFAHSLNVYKYLKSINRLDSSIAENAHDSMLKGYQDVRGMQSFNGGFKLWRGEFEDIWFSAYVAQILGDASGLISVDPRLHKKSLNYLRSKQNDDGSFQSVSRKFESISQEICLTAFVVIAFAKNKGNSQDFAYVHSRAIKYLLDKNKSNDYEKAIVAYAFALSEQIEKATDVFNNITRNALDHKRTQIKASDIETASYITLTAIKLRRFDYAEKNVKWLIKRRKQNGEFISTHDTVLGLEALTAYQEFLNLHEPLMSIKFNGVIEEKIASKIDLKIVEIPSNTRHLMVKAKGRGLALVNVFYQYKVKQNLTKKLNVAFIGAQKTREGTKLNFETSNRSNRKSEAIAEVDLPSGFEYVEGAFGQQVESIHHGTKILLNLGSITNRTKFSIMAKKYFNVKQERKSLVKVYDHLEPDQYFAQLLYKLKKDNNCSSETTEEPLYSYTTRMSTTTFEPGTTPSPKIEHNDTNLMSNKRSSSDYAAFILQKNKFGNEFIKACNAFFINEKKVMTAPSKGCIIPRDKNQLKVQIFWSDNFNDFKTNITGVTKVDEYQEKFLILSIETAIEKITDVKIGDVDLNVLSLNCTTVSFDKRNSKIYQKNVSLGSVGNKFVSSTILEGKKIGNPLICEDEGEKYLVGLSVSVNEKKQVVYQDIRGSADLIHQIKDQN